MLKREGGRFVSSFISPIPSNSFFYLPDISETCHGMVSVQGEYTLLWNLCEGCHQCRAGFYYCCQECSRTGCRAPVSFFVLHVALSGNRWPFSSEQKSSRIVYHSDLTRHRLTDYVPAESIIRVLCILSLSWRIVLYLASITILYRFINIVKIQCRCMHPPNAAWEVIAR